MVNYCAIIGCTNTGGKDTVSFYRLPAVISNQGVQTRELPEKRRRVWLFRISRADLLPTSYPYLRVCSVHFESGTNYSYLALLISIVDIPSLLLCPNMNYPKNAFAYVFTDSVTAFGVVYVRPCTLRHISMLFKRNM